MLKPHSGKKGHITLLLPFLFGLWLVSFQVSEQFKARSSEEWPTTPGMLKTSGDDYRARLSYTYKVGSREYSSDRIIYGQSGDRKRLADRGRFQAMGDGSEVVVHYKPGDPGESTLIVGRVAETSGSDLLVGSTFILMSALLLVVLRRPPRKDESC